MLTDIEGEPVPFAQYNLYPDYLYFDVHYENHGFEAYRVFYLPVSQYEFEGLLNQAQNNYVERYEGEDIDSVNFYYAIIVLSNSGQATSFMFILD